MAWEWSHTAEAYAAVEQNIRNQPREWLECVWAEWKADTTDDDGCEGFNQERYDQALQEVKSIPDDILADAIWERTSNLATCTNGGWEAHCCPFGCGCHMVPFEVEEEADEPEEGDYVTKDHRTFYIVGESRAAFTLGEEEDMYAALRLDMDRRKFWPNVWFLSDHGNCHRI